MSSPLKETKEVKNKIENIQSSPLGRMIMMNGVGENIQSFFSFSSYLPICSLFHLSPSKEMKSCLFIGNRFSKSLLKSIETIRLFRWYVWLRKILQLSKKGMICYAILHVDSVSKGDIGFYLYWGRRGKDWKALKKGIVKNEMAYYYICMTIWAEYFGYVSFDNVPSDHRNIYLSIRYGMWDRADRYIKRGDGDGYWGDVIASINHDDLKRLVRTHDLQESLFLAPDYRTDIVEILLYEGILMKRVVDRGGYGGILPFLGNHQRCSDIVQGPQKCSLIPMNVIEDLFVISVGDARGQESPWQDIRDMVMRIVSIFFDLLQRGDRGEERANHVFNRRRMYRDENIDDIVSVLRGEGDAKKQRDIAIIMLTLYLSDKITERRLENIDPSSVEENDEDEGEDEEGGGGCIQG